jgi:hypothetical protein
MILFFDKNFGTSVPKALSELKPPFEVDYFQKHFELEIPDDKWLPVAGEKHWTVIGHDNFTKNESELYAINKYSVGCFYLWGAKAPKWVKVKLLFKAIDKIIDAENHTRRPFVFAVKKNGNLKQIKLPKYQN